MYANHGCMQTITGCKSQLHANQTIVSNINIFMKWIFILMQGTQWYKINSIVLALSMCKIRQPTLCIELARQKTGSLVWTGICDFSRLSVIKCTFRALLSCSKLEFCMSFRPVSVSHIINHSGRPCFEIDFGSKENL